MLTALASAPAGAAQLSKSPELVNDLITHLHFGPPRSQRLVRRSLAFFIVLTHAHTHTHTPIFLLSFSC